MPFNTRGQRNFLRREAATQKKRNEPLFVKKHSETRVQKPQIQSHTQTKSKRLVKPKKFNVKRLLFQLMILFFKLKIDPASVAAKYHKEHFPGVNFKVSKIDDGHLKNRAIVRLGNMTTKPTSSRESTFFGSVYVPEKRNDQCPVPGYGLELLNDTCVVPAKDLPGAAASLLMYYCPKTQYGPGLLQPKCMNLGLQSFVQKWAKRAQKEAAELPKKDPTNNVCREPESVCKGGLGLPRNVMPDISNPDDFLERINKQFGIEFKHDTVLMGDLIPAQGEIRRGRVDGAMKEMNNEGLVRIKQKNGPNIIAAPIIISQDNYIVDGHHRWAAALEKGLDDKKIPVIRIMAPIQTVLFAAANEPNNPF